MLVISGTWLWEKVVWNSRQQANGEWNRLAWIMMINFAESGHPTFQATSPAQRGELKSKGGGKKTIHYNGSEQTIELILRTIVSVNQSRIYGAVADLCKELDLDYTKSVIWESLVVPTERADAYAKSQSSTQSAQRNLRKDLRSRRQHAENTLILETSQHLDREGGFVQIRRSAQSWMWNSMITKDVIALTSWSNHCLKTEQFYGFALWMAPTNASQKRPKKYPLRTSTGKSVAKAKPRPKLVVKLSSNSIPINERKWIDIDTQQFDHSCFEVSKLMTRTLRHDAWILREIDGQ